MSIEREILITVLKLTRKGPIDRSLVAKTARIPHQATENFLRKLADASVVKCRGKILETSPDKRVKIAVQAIKLGADFERVCRMLEWKEFESIATTAFENYSYHVIKNFRFKGKNGKRWEIDLLAFKQPIIASIDCKHWNRGWTRASIVKTVVDQVERSKAFSDRLPNLCAKIRLDKWEQAIAVPIILSLLPSPFKFYCNTPIVPVLQLQSFLNELPAHISVLTFFNQKLTRIDREITDY